MGDKFDLAAWLAGAWKIAHDVFEVADWIIGLVGLIMTIVIARKVASITKSFQTRVMAERALSRLIAFAKNLRGAHQKNRSGQLIAEFKKAEVIVASLLTLEGDTATRATSAKESILRAIGEPGHAPMAISDIEGLIEAVELYIAEKQWEVKDG